MRRPPPEKASKPLATVSPPKASKPEPPSSKSQHDDVPVLPEPAQSAKKPQKKEKSLYEQIAELKAAVAKFSKDQTELVRAYTSLNTEMYRPWPHPSGLPRPLQVKNVQDTLAEKREIESECAEARKRALGSAENFLEAKKVSHVTY